MLAMAPSSQELEPPANPGRFKIASYSAPVTIYPASPSLLPSYAGGRCADIIEGLASRIDASEFGDDCPSYFPRFIQQAIWRFCAQDVLNVCNGNRIDDHSRCGNWCCPMFQNCHRVSVF